jgi:hypothetical protein
MHPEVPETVQRENPYTYSDVEWKHQEETR